MFGKRWFKRQKIRAVYDSDLDRLLESLGAKQEILDGKHKCIVCGRVINLENLAVVYPKAGAIYFVCDHISCVIESKTLDK